MRRSTQITLDKILWGAVLTECINEYECWVLAMTGVHTNTKKNNRHVRGEVIECVLVLVKRRMRYAMGWTWAEDSRTWIFEFSLYMWFRIYEYIGEGKND